MSTVDARIDEIIAQTTKTLNRASTNKTRISLRKAQVDALDMRRNRDDMPLIKEIIQETATLLVRGDLDPDEKLMAFDTVELAYCVGGFWDFEYFMYGLEFRRPPQKRFYQPREKQLHEWAAEITAFVVDRKYDILVLNSPPRIGKSTIGLMAMVWAGAREPEKQNILTGYSSTLTDSFYKEINSITEDEQYNFKKCFPTLRRVGQSAEYTTIDYTDDPKRTTMARFPTWACRGVNASVNGVTECENIMYFDDMVKNYEETLSIEQMDKLYAIITTDFLGRGKEGFRQLHIGTLWSIHSPLGKIIQNNKDNPRFKLLSRPALDPITDESNFQYDYGVGFSTAYYRNQRKILIDNDDLVSWECLFQQHFIERGSIMFPETELLRFKEPDFVKKSPPDELFAFVDCAFGGADYLSMPIAAQYGDTVYIIDWVFLKGDYKVTQPVVYSKIREHKLQRVIFEANNGGDFYGRDIEEMLNKDHKGFVYVGNRTAPGKMGKMARIEQHSPVIKKFVFLAEICYNDTMYKDAIKNLTSYSRTTQNKNDDAPDSLAGLAAMMRQNLVSTIQVIPRDLI